MAICSHSNVISTLCRFYRSKEEMSHRKYLWLSLFYAYRYINFVSMDVLHPGRHILGHFGDVASLICGTIGRLWDHDMEWHPAGSPEPLLVAYATIHKFAWRGPYVTILRVHIEDCDNNPGMNSMIWVLFVRTCNLQELLCEGYGIFCHLSQTSQWTFEVWTF